MLCQAIFEAIILLLDLIFKENLKEMLLLPDEVIFQLLHNLCETF
jgi:hypothetical protein